MFTLLVNGDIDQFVDAMHGIEEIDFHRHIAVITLAGCGPSR